MGYPILCSTSASRLHDFSSTDLTSKDGFLEDAEQGAQMGVVRLLQAQEKSLEGVGGLRSVIYPFCPPVR